MARGSIKKNYILNVCYQLLSVITPLITTPYISRVLEADGIGAYSYADSISSYFVIFAILGTATYAQREVSYVQDDIVKRSRIFWETLILRIVTTLIAIAVYMLIFKRNTLFMILSVNIIAVACDVTWFFQGMEEFGKIVGRNTLFKLLNIAFIFLAVKTKGDLLLYVGGIVGLNLIGQVSLWTLIPEYVCVIEKEELRPFRDITTVVSLFIPTVAIQVYTICDKTMIGFFTETDFENGYYEQTMKIVRVLQFIVTSLATVMAPRIGYCFAQGKNREIQEYMLKSYNFAWAVAIPFCLGIMGISDNMVPWFFGEGFGKVSVLLKILPVIVVAIGLSNITGVQYLLPTKQQNKYTRSVIIGAMINFAINLILIPKFFSIGATIASVAAETVIMFVQFYYVRKEINIPDVLKLCKNYIIAGALMLIVLRIENEWLDSCMLNTVIMMVTGMIVYIVATVIMKDRFIIENAERMFGLIYTALKHKMTNYD